MMETPLRGAKRSARHSVPGRRAGSELDDPALFLNRELSLLAFNRRVLEQVRDPATPLLERLRFLGISSTNLDEFFEIRVAGLKQQVAYDVQQTSADGKTAREALEQIATVAHALVDKQYALLQDVLLPELRAAGIELLAPAECNAAQRAWIAEHFRTEVAPVLTPMGLDPAHPFPRVLNKSLNVIVSVEGVDAFGRNAGIAVVQVPRSLPRIVELPPSTGGRHCYVPLSEIVSEHVAEMFPCLRLSGCSAFRVTRNSDLWVDEEEVDNLLAAIKGELPGRNYSEAVRLEVDADCPDDVAQGLLSRTNLGPEDLYRCHGPVNLHRLAALRELVDRPDLKYPPFVPGLPRRLTPEKDLFAVLRRGDILLHHPYQSFTPVVDLVRRAATDPAVLAVKVILYRTGAQSPLGDALIEAARAGKEVTAVIELRARFDEAANIDLATRLQEAGVLVVYGVVGYKCHAKLLLIVRRERGLLRRYVHLGTGNYHPDTTRAYTDFGLLSTDADLAEDVHRLFARLTGLGEQLPLEKVLDSPFTLAQRLDALIGHEAQRARAGRTSGIRARMNSLSEPGIIRALYRASRAGVPIDLMVRGICCLRPGVPGVSETIRVRSVVGRFLEHARAWWFYADGREEVFLSSADWMSRNLYRRVEAAFPVEDSQLKQRVIDEGLEAYFRDDSQAWLLRPDGSYVRARPGDKPRCAQSQLLARLSARTNPPPVRRPSARRPPRGKRQTRSGGPPA
jgi:polyphosphate kinase